MILITAHAWVDDLAGGSFKLATEFAESLADRGRRVHYVCCGHERTPPPRTVERGVTVWRYPRPRGRGPFALWGHVRGTAAAVQRVLAEAGPPDCLNGHTPLQFTGALRGLRGAKSRAREGGRTVYTVHSPFADEFAAEGRRGPQAWSTRVAAELEGRNCRRADAIVGLSAFTLHRLRALCPDISTLRDAPVGGASVCHGWIDIERFQPVEDRPALRARLGGAWANAAEEPTFFTLRRLHRRMGLDLLIDAAAALDRSGKRFRLLIGGGGPLRGELQARIDSLGLSERVTLLGFVPDEDLPDCYAAADCFVLPTRDLECFGLIILESYAAGVPVIATPVAAIPELVTLAGDGWLTETASAEALADRMQAFLAGRLAGDPAKLRGIAEGFDRTAGVSALESVCFSGRSVSSRDPALS
ncbi:glycosyltransferase family 4 protein [Alienimonas chondri]|uniref:D-inositol-3-phosphate glycosyltransferase n=1 Tax=Alienimonas chondri TaxID=2681879 RepID=A0ABX1VGJ3_9PLAN|nr:glycosyltransferase family 4 protein [Alienimonas chondri]NNJ26387.1 D-inositol-3-phosphate glycosyltransferase [Alienimonas chondri]